MRHRICKSVIAILLILSIGGHWALLQSVAWVTMVVNYSKEAPIEVAVSKTFDGKHECKICKLVRHGKEREKNQDAIKVKTKLDFWIPVREISLAVPSAETQTSSAFISSLHSRSEPPPFPPPRRA